MPTYKKNFLTNVIARVDFNPILSIKSTEPVDFQDAIRSNFPRLERVDGVELSIGPTGATSNQAPTVWKFISKDNKRSVSLCFNYLALEFTSYSDSKELFAQLEPVFDVFNRVYKPDIIKRIGLRYINQISLSGNPFEWTGYINPTLYSFLSFMPKPQDSVYRAMTQMHIKVDDALVIFQHGIFNTQYPNSITKKEFVLDFDCINSDERDVDSTLPCLKRFNKYIEDLFESSIGDSLRTEMGKLS